MGGLKGWEKKLIKQYQRDLIFSAFLLGIGLVVGLLGLIPFQIVITALAIILAISTLILTVAKGLAIELKLEEVD